MASQTQTQRPLQKQTYAARAALPATPPLADYLFRLMELKKSNICLAADDYDGITTAELTLLAEECGDAIVVLKLHSDAIWDLSPDTVDVLTKLSIRKRFLLFDDRLFGNHSPSIVAQYAATPLHPGAWTSLTSAHIVHGDAVVKCLRAAAVSLLSRFHADERSASRPSLAGRKTSSDYFGRASPSSRRAKSASSPAGPYDDCSPGCEEAHYDDGDDDAPPSPTAERRRVSLRPASARQIPTSSSSSSMARALSFANTNPAGRRHGPSPSITSITSDPFDRRKSSIVSISTTISSSTEYIGSPPPQHSRFPLLPTRHAPAGISTSASSPGLSPDADDHDGAASASDNDASDAASTTAASPTSLAANADFTAAGPPQSRGILLNTDLDASAFADASLPSSTAPASLNTHASYRRGCVRVARVNHDFVLGFVANGARAVDSLALAPSWASASTSAAAAARHDAGDAFVTFVSGCCLPGDEASVKPFNDARRRRRRHDRQSGARRMGGLGGDGYSDSSEEEAAATSEEETCDEADEDEEGHSTAAKSALSRSLLSAMQTHTHMHTTPAALVARHGADVLIVGAPIMRALSRREAVERYRQAGWAAYVESLPLSSRTGVNGASHG